jgi:hypothetical protein
MGGHGMTVFTPDCVSSIKGKVLIQTAWTLLAILASHFVNWPVRLILCSLTVSPPSVSKPYCPTDDNVSPVDDEDDEDYYSDPKDQGPLHTDDDTHNLASQDDG